MSEETKAPETAKPAPAATPKPAAEKKEEAPAPPDPREIAGNEFLTMVQGRVVKQFGEDVLEAAELKKYQATLTIKNERFLEVATFLKDEPTLAFTYPEAMAGTDYKDYMEVWALVHSFELDKDLAIKVRTPRDTPSVPSITPIYSGFNWEEREIFDLLGIEFRGHPDLRKIMLPDEWKGHPLRKDYVVED